jgi:hypothetical protein
MQDPGMLKMARKLIEEVGSKEECLRLGFLGKDDNETLFVTSLGGAFLFDVVVPETDTLAEAYAAGWRKGCATGFRECGVQERAA